jgi:hypothetical protein
MFVRVIYGAYSMQSVSLRVVFDTALYDNVCQ